MDHFSIWPSIVVFSACVLLLSPARLWRFLDESAIDGKRYIAVDGLRGFLAIAVVLHHCAISYAFHQTGRWEVPPSPYYVLLGQGGVSVFFMITAFLFWGRIVDQDGRVDWLALYWNRLFRIGPLYWAAVGVMLFLVAYKTDFKIQVSAGQLAVQLAQWALPAIVNQPIVNGYANTSLILAGVTWTLYYEWMFYLSLPVLAIAAVKRSPVGFLPTLLWLLFIVPGVFFDFEHAVLVRYFLALFGIGMVAATAVRRFPAITGDGPLRSALAVLLLVGFFANNVTAYAWASVAYLGAFFLLISTGTSLFGLLRTRAALRLGAISYSIYLLQGLVILVMLSPRALGIFATDGPPQYWLTVLAIALALVGVSVMAYCLIERPGINLGKRLLSHISATQRAKISILPAGVQRGVKGLE